MILHDKDFTGRYYRIAYCGSLCARLQDNTGKNWCISIPNLQHLIHETKKLRHQI